MRILVTGQNGYIGPVLTGMLLAEGYEVSGLDSDFFVGCNFNIGAPDIPQVRKDIRDVVAADLEGFDAVIHLAALSNDPIGNLNPNLTYEINHKASVRLAELAKQVGISRFLFASSCSLYGAASGEEVLNEEAAFNPVTPYGVTKVLFEQDVSKLADKNFSPVFLRNATAYGVSPRLRFGLVLHDLVALAYTTGLVYMKSDGTPWRPIVHVADISRAFIAALRAPRDVIHNQAFNVGISTENYQIRELAEIVQEVVPNCRIEYAPGAEPDKRSYRVDFSKIQKTLPEFKPQWNARRGAQELYEAFQKAELTYEDYEAPTFKRLDRIKELLSTGQLDLNLRWTEKVIV